MRKIHLVENKLMNSTRQDRAHRGDSQVIDDEVVCALDKMKKACIVTHVPDRITLILDGNDSLRAEKVDQQKVQVLKLWVVSIVFYNLIRNKHTAYNQIRNEIVKP